MSEDTNITLSPSQVEDPLGADRDYLYFVGASLGSWGICFLLIMFPRVIVYLCHRPQKRTGTKSTRTDQVLVEPSFYSSIQNWAEDLISGNTTTGRILVVFAFACSMVSFVLYIISKSQSISQCGHLTSHRRILYLVSANCPMLEARVTKCN